MRVISITVSITILLLISTTTKFVQAESVQGDDMPVLNKKQEEKVDKTQQQASNLLLLSAEWIDSFFDNPRSIAEENQTRARLRLIAGYSKKDDFKFKPRFDLYLKLPRLSDKLYLTINASDDDTDLDLLRSPITDRSDFREDADNSEVTAGLRQFIIEEDDYNLSADVGISWDYAYGGARFRALEHLGGDWQARLTNRLRYYTDIKWENITALDIETWFKKKFLFRSTTAVTLSEVEPGIPHGQYFGLTHVLSPHQAAIYESAIYLDTEPSYTMTDLQFRVRYRQRFYRDWLIFEVAPVVTFPEEDDYETNLGIVFSLEATIGYITDEMAYNEIFR